jgi:hypothetical protein
MARQDQGWFGQCWTSLTQHSQQQQQQRVRGAGSNVYQHIGGMLSLSCSGNRGDISHSSVADGGNFRASDVLLLLLVVLPRLGST